MSRSRLEDTLANLKRKDLLDVTCRLIAACRDLQIYAKRYAEGRHTTACSTVNRVTRALLYLGVELDPGREGTLWAKDGSLPELSEEHYRPHHPIALGYVEGLPRFASLSEELQRLLNPDGNNDIAVTVERVHELLERCGEAESPKINKKRACDPFQ